MGLTRDLGDDFFIGLKQVADNLDSDAMYIMMVMQSESGVSAKAHNPKGNASGLIQFMPNTLLGLRWTKGDAAFRQLNASAQLPFVEKYFMPYKGNLEDVAGIYTATFLPAEIEHRNDQEYVLSQRGGHLGWAYAPNAVFDQNRDYKITIGELVKAVERNCVGKRWNELVARLTGDGLEEAPTDIIGDLSQLRAVQTALYNLGFDVGPIDGIMGPKTHAAIMAFQKSAKLVVDGIYGPKTRAAITEIVTHVK